jgi:hypothetical protein
VDSLAQAARIVNGTAGHDGIAALLASLGFPDDALELDADAIARMGLPSSVRSARVSCAEGTLRALSVEIANGVAIRDCIGDVTHRLSICAPHLLWLVFATQQKTGHVAITTWQYRDGKQRIVAMITTREDVIDSDAETLCSLAAASSVPGDAMRHARWVDILGRDSITRRFFVALSRAIDSLAASIPCIPITDAREISILTTSRLLFLSFLETKGWLDADFGFLANGFAECMTDGGGYQRRVLDPLFFGTLNTRVSKRSARARKFGRVPFLNGGLFARTPVERIHRHARFSDDVLGALFGDVLVRYRFTAHEDAAGWSQAAIDPEILGKVFESLMESGTRKRSGVFFTPQHFVERVTLQTLSTTLQRHGFSCAEADRIINVDTDEIHPNPIALDRIRALRILDPACGSGAFLIYILERLARLRVALGEHGSVSDVRRSVLAQSIFGVDSNPTAIWLCELRLWLSTVIDSEERDPMRIRPLPNLDRQIRVGDSLAGDVFENGQPRLPSSRKQLALRERYTRASGSRKVSLGRQLDALERRRALDDVDAAIAIACAKRKDILNAARSPDLFDARRPPDARRRARMTDVKTRIRLLRRRRTSLERGATPAFTYPTHFADVAIAGGFDAIIGNPPWVRPHNISMEDRARYRERFMVCRAGAWVEGARSTAAGIGFAGQTDLAALFVERSIDLLGPDGTLGLLLPAKLWRSLAGGGARHLVLQRTRIVSIEDHTADSNAFQAAVYPSILVATRQPHASVAENRDDRPVRVGVKRDDGLIQWNVDTRTLPLDASPGSPWLLLPRESRTAFDSLANAGLPMFESILGRPHLGVKTGYNDAFVVTSRSNGSDRTKVTAGTRQGEIEAELLRPLVRGETLTSWRLTDSGERIIWTHDKAG